MATFSLELPAGLEEWRKAIVLKKAFLAGVDGNPVPTQREFKDSILGLRQHGEESVRAVTPWWIDGKGMLASSTATLMNREKPYSLIKELARGKLNQIRGMVADWESRGLEISPKVRDSILVAGRKLGKVMGLALGDPKAEDYSGISLQHAYSAARDLVECYCEALMAAKKRQTNRLPTIQSFYLRGKVPDSSQTGALLKAFNGVQVAVPWSQVEPEPGRFDWSKMDSLIEWGRQHGLPVGLGPVVDLNIQDLPAWFLPLAGDINRAAGVIFRYLDQVITRTRGKVSTFHVIQGGNFTDTDIGDLDETEWLRLTFNACLRVRQAQAEIPLGVGIVQPWGELLSMEHRDHNPFLFAEALSRSVDGLGSIDVEMAFSQEGRGSIARDTLEMARMLEQLSYMGTPLRLDFAPPPPLPAYGITKKDTVDFIKGFYQLALASPLVSEIRWCETFEGERKLFPGAGLFGEGALGDPNEVLSVLGEFRANNLR